MKLPRDLSAAELIAALARVGYARSRQTGSHIRLTRASPTEHHVTLPNHDPIKLGTLNAILREIAEKNQLSRDELLRRLFP